MNIETLPVNLETLTEYSSIPMIYEVTDMLSIELIDSGIGGMIFHEKRIVTAFTRDFDALDGETPVRWVKNFNTANWVLFLAREDGVPLGGATVVTRTPEVNMLKGRNDIAVLWDIRVKPEHKRSGIGTRLFQAAADWSRRQKLDYLKIESQNINVPACRFYIKQGCELGEVNRFAYTNPESISETMLVWYLDLKA